MSEKKYWPQTRRRQLSVHTRQRGPVVLQKHNSNLLNNFQEKHNWH